MLDAFVEASYWWFLLVMVMVTETGVMTKVGVLE